MPAGIKRRPKPTISKGWWKDAWPDMRQPNCYNSVRAAIDAYKRAKGGVASDYIAAYKALVDSVNAAQLEAAKKIKDANAREAIIADLGVVLKTATTERKKVTVGTATREVFIGQFGAAVNELLPKDCRYKMGPTVIRCSILATAHDEIKEGGAEALMQDRYKKILDEHAKKCAKDIIQSMQRYFLTYAVRDEVTRVGDRIRDRYVSDLNSEMQVVPSRVLKKLNISPDLAKQYEKRMSSTGKAIVKNVASSALAPAGVVLPGTQVFALLMLARSIAGIVGDVAEASKTVREYISGIEDDLKYIQKHSSGKRIASEAGAEFVNTVLNVHILPTVKSLKDNMKACEQRMARALVISFRVRKEIDQLKAELKWLTTTHRDLARNGGHRILEDVGKRKDAAKNEIEALVRNSKDFLKEVHDLDYQVSKLKKRVKLIAGSTSKEKFARNATAALVDLAGVAAGGIGDATEAFKAAEGGVSKAGEIQSVANSVVGASDAVCSKLKEFFDNVRK